MKIAISHHLVEAVDRTRRGDFSKEGLTGFNLRVARTRCLSSRGYLDFLFPDCDRRTRAVGSGRHSAPSTFRPSARVGRDCVISGNGPSTLRPPTCHVLSICDRLFELLVREPRPRDGGASQCRPFGPP